MIIDKFTLFRALYSKDYFHINQQCLAGLHQQTYLPIPTSVTNQSVIIINFLFFIMFIRAQEMVVCMQQHSYKVRSIYSSISLQEEVLNLSVCLSVILSLFLSTGCIGSTAFGAH